MNALPWPWKPLTPWAFVGWLLYQIIRRTGLAPFALVWLGFVAGWVAAMVTCGQRWEL